MALELSVHRAKEVVYVKTRCSEKKRLASRNHLITSFQKYIAFRQLQREHYVQAGVREMEPPSPSIS